MTHPLNKLDDRRYKIIIEAIRGGNSRSTAFKLAGIHMDTGFDWLRYGRQNPEKFPQYVKLREDIEQAEAEFEADRVAIVKTAGDTGTWQAAAWWLERKRPEDWGRNRDPTPPAELSRPTVNILILEDPNAREASRELLRHLAGGGSNLAIGPGPVRESSEDT